MMFILSDSLGGCRRATSNILYINQRSHGTAVPNAPMRMIVPSYRTAGSLAHCAQGTATSSTNPSPPCALNFRLYPQKWLLAKCADGFGTGPKESVALSTVFPDHLRAIARTESHNIAQHFRLTAL